MVVLWVFAMFMIHGLLAIMIIALLVLASVASEYSLFFLIILGVVLINSYLDNVKHATKGDKGDRVSGLYHVLIGFMYGDSSFGR